MIFFLREHLFVYFSGLSFQVVYNYAVYQYYIHGKRLNVIKINDKIIKLRFVNITAGVQLAVFHLERLIEIQVFL